MRHKKPLFLISTGGLMLFIGISLWLLTPQLVAAQCGTQASSCKNCHEVQAQDPVNNDGNGWHVSHAFGDFCTFCHAGNDQATDKAAAHVGMVPPLSDVKSACQQCHPSDVMARAQVYATKLNVKVGDGAASQVNPTSEPAPSATPVPQQAAPVQPTAQPAAASVPSDNQIVVNDPNAVDYVQRYDEIVLGERPVNWGNIALFGVIGLLVVGGGGFVLFNELRLMRAAGDLRKVEGEYPADVVDMLPAIARLKVQARQALKHILSNPQKSDKVLGLIDTMVSEEGSEEPKA